MEISRSLGALIEKFERNGTVLEEKRTVRPESATNIEYCEEIKAKITEEPMSTIKKSAVESGLSIGSVAAILRSFRFRPYKLRGIRYWDHHRRG